MRKWLQLGDRVRQTFLRPTPRYRKRNSNMLSDRRHFFGPIMRRLVLSFACLASLSACTFAPTAGPSTDAIVESREEGGAGRYAVVDIDSIVAEAILGRRPDNSLANFGDYRSSVEPRIGVGDAVSVTIWEGSGGGLFCRAAHDRPFHDRLAQRDHSGSGCRSGRHDHSAFRRPPPRHWSNDTRRSDANRAGAHGQGNSTSGAGQRDQIGQQFGDGHWRGHGRSAHSLVCQGRPHPRRDCGGRRSAGSSQREFHSADFAAVAWRGSP